MGILSGPGQAEQRRLKIWWAGQGRAVKNWKWDGMGRAAAHEMWSLYGPLRPALEADHVFWQAGPDRCPWDPVYYTATTLTFTVPMRPPTCFDGPARAVAHEMWCTAATATTCSGVPGSLSAKTSNVRTMHF